MTTYKNASFKKVKLRDGSFGTVVYYGEKTKFVHNAKEARLFIDGLTNSI